VGKAGKEAQGDKQKGRKGGEKMRMGRGCGGCTWLGNKGGFRLQGRQLDLGVGLRWEGREGDEKRIWGYKKTGKLLGINLLGILYIDPTPRNFLFK